MSADSSDAEIREEFTRIVAGLEFDAHTGLLKARLRRPALPSPVLLRVRVDLDDATPPIWRRLEIRSDLTLVRLHDVLQIAFGWQDAHPHVFTLGGRAHEESAERFLSRFDNDDLDGTPEHEVRVDETLQDVGDVLHYLYDYRDDWQLTITVEEVLPVSAVSPDAICTGGRRAAPPEGSGGIRTASALAEILPDPAAFELSAVNEVLTDPNPLLTATAKQMAVPREALTKLPWRLVEILQRTSGDTATDVAERLHKLNRIGVTHVDIEQALLPLTRFLRMLGPGVQLGRTGLIPPRLARDLASFLPAMADWITPVMGEADARPVYEFRRATQELGLTRKYRGDLLPTAAGRNGLRDPFGLWDHLVERIAAPPKRGSDMRRLFRRDLALVALFYVATDATMPFHKIIDVLEHSWWKTSREVMVRVLENFLSSTRATLDAVGGLHRGPGITRTFGVAAQVLAAEALAAAAEED